MGGISWEDEERIPLEDDWLGLTRGAARVLVVPTAVADAAEPTLGIVSQLHHRAEVSFVQFFPWPPGDLRALALGQDAIYVSGGNTANALAIWRVHGFDAILREAWEARHRARGLERRDDLLVRGRRDRLVRPAARRHARRARLPARERVPALRRRGRRRPVYTQLARGGSRPGSLPTIASRCASTAPSSPRSSAPAPARAPTASVRRARSRSSRVGSSPLRLHGVLRVARRLEAGLEDRPAQRSSPAEDERAAARPRPRGCAGPRRASSAAPPTVAGLREPARSLPAAPCRYGSPSEAEPLLHRAASAPCSASDAADREPPRRAGVLAGGSRSVAAAPALAAALAPKTNGSSRRASCQTGTAVSRRARRCRSRAGAAERARRRARPARLTRGRPPSALERGRGRRRAAARRRGSRCRRSSARSTLKTRSMFRNRSGRPRSEIRSGGLTTSAAERRRRALVRASRSLPGSARAEASTAERAARGRR